MEERTFMKIFKCQNCGQLVYFENAFCERCSDRLGYLPDRTTMSAVESDGALWRALAVDSGERYQFCANAQFGACNWMLPAGSPEAFCLACRHNQVIPDMSFPENLPRWQKLEQAKRRLFYSLLRFGLPIANRADDPQHGLTFQFLAVAPDLPKVTTGHDNGIITLALHEADEVERERTRVEMGETYRTLLGHFRHEVGHYYWDVLVRDGRRLDDFRALFGDEQQNYEEALKRHYEVGPPANWRDRFISSYASSHPWEDFAETWSHYLHIVDTLEMGFAFGLRIEPRIMDTDALNSALDFDPYRAVDTARLIDAWLPLVFAVNSLNRTMGQPDLYPFVLTPGVVDKLAFIHSLVHR